MLTIPQSSLAFSLLRGILTEGTVYYNGIPINTLNLDAIRSNITIIPQVVSEHLVVSCLELANRKCLARASYRHFTSKSRSF
jgi:hypothetical protein